MISASDYATIAGIIGGGNDLSLAAVKEITQSNAALQSASVSNSALQAQMSDSLLQASSLLLAAQVPTSTMKRAVAALQSHVARNTGSVDAFLSDNGIKVSQTFANISAFAGYTISPSNVS